ncbi:MAG: hypothetical protein ABIR15_06660 [Chitinophagaceae bacterium]
MIVSCSKQPAERTNFAELTLGGEKFVFDSLEAIFDTSTQGITCNVRVYDRASHSNMMWETMSGSKWINGVYEYPGDLLPGRSVVFLHVQTYKNRIPGTYTLQNNSLTLTIDQSENRRLHGRFSGKITCYTCTPHSAEVSITNGELEMLYSYR